MELTTNVPNLESMSECSLKHYDAIYMGMPYCWDYEGSFSSGNDIEEGVELLRELGKKAYLSLYAAPRNKDLERVFYVVELGLDAKVDAFEVFNLGVAKKIKDEYDARVHLGGLANVYTTSTAELLYSLGIDRIMPAYELPIEDIEKIKEVGVEIEVVIHGKIPLGISHECFVRRFEKEVGKRCPKLCKEKLWFKSEDLVLKPFGQVTLSGKDVCMYEHLEKLNFVDAARIEALSERVGYREEVGRIYRKRIEKGFDKKDFLKLIELAEIGLCNGFYFNKAGQIYVSR